MCCAALYHAHHQLVAFMLVISLVWSGLNWNGGSRNPSAPSSSTLRTYATARVGVAGRDVGALMFRYAALVAAAERSGVTAVWLKHGTLTDVFTLRSARDSGSVAASGAHLWTSSDIRRVVKTSVMVSEANCSSCLRGGTILLDRRKNTTLQGAFRNYTYFDGYESTLLERFQFRQEIFNHVLRFFTQSERRRGFERVGIHLETPGVCGYSLHDIEAFAIRAVRYLTSRAGVHRLEIVLSGDNLQWLQHSSLTDALSRLAQTTDADFADNILRAPTSDRGLQMALLSECDHVIVCGGTTAWWAGWMVSEKRAGTVIYCSCNLQDAVYPSWIGV